MYNSKNIFLITGATSGIGKGVALELNRLGATVIAVGRNQKKLESLKKNIINPRNLILEEKDLSKQKDLDKWVLNISRKYGHLQGLVLAAGIQQTLPLAAPSWIEKSKDLFEINFFSNFQISKGFCDRRVNIGKGSSIVFLSSIASIKGNKGLIAYAASKGAINSAVKSLALEVAKLGIRVNTILPGFIKTQMIEDWQNNNYEKYIEYINKQYPLGIGEIEDIVEPILFLLSDKSKWITGSELIVDGGGSI